MALYLISYDINEKSEFEYGPLWQELREMGAKKILYSEWVITGETGTAHQIYDQIAPLTSINDRLLVQEITKDGVWDKLLISDDSFRELLRRARG
jgi:hypothetical protein